MQCPLKTGRSSELALDYMSGRLALEAVEELERHCEECPECREFFAAGRAVREALDGWEAPAITPEFDRRLRERIAAEQARRSWWRKWLAPLSPGTPKPALALASLAVIVAAAALLWAPAPSGRETARGAPEGVDVEQIEQVVEDLDMLYLLDPAVLEQGPAQPGTPEPEKIGRIPGRSGRSRCA